MLEILAKQQGPDMEENTEDALAGKKRKKKRFCYFYGIVTNLLSLLSWKEA